MRTIVTWNIVDDVQTLRTEYGQSRGQLPDLQHALEILDAKTDIDSQTHSLEVSRLK